MIASRTLILPAMLMAVASLAFAQEARKTRRLESVTWTPSDHKLTWVVLDGAVGDKGKFQPNKKTTYEIDMDAATMKLEGENRRFSKMEAVSVHRLMDMVAKYAAESTLWWEAGQGEKLDEDGDTSRVDGKKERDRNDSFVPDRVPSRGRDRDKKVIRISVEDLPTPQPLQMLEEE